MENEEYKVHVYSIRENWELLKPYLKNKDVQEVLNRAMTNFNKERANEKKWRPGNAPWEYTTSSYWFERIENLIVNDDQYQKDLKSLDDFDEKQLDLLRKKYYKKHSPKKDTIEWYQFVHGCHWINQFTAALISKAFDVEVDVWQTDTHTIAAFSKDGKYYLADILGDLTGLDTFEKLYNYMGNDVDYYTIFKQVA